MDYEILSLLRNWKEFKILKTNHEVHLQKLHIILFHHFCILDFGFIINS